MRKRSFSRCCNIGGAFEGTATTPEHWQLMEALYHAALEVSGEERAALLAKADPEVRRAVEALLAQGGSGEAVLDRPAWDQAQFFTALTGSRAFLLVIPTNDSCPSTPPEVESQVGSN